MTKVDQFESMFRAAQRESLRYERPESRLEDLTTLAHLEEFHNFWKDGLSTNM